MTAAPANTTKEKMSRPPKLLASGSEIGGAGVVIVGGGSGAFYATESLREASCVSPRWIELKPDLFISMGSKRRSQSSPRKQKHPLTGVSPNYTSVVTTSSPTHLRTKLSKALITDASKLEWRTPADLKIKYGTVLRTGTVGLPSTLLRFESV